MSDEMEYESEEPSEEEMAKLVGQLQEAADSGVPRYKLRQDLMQEGMSKEDATLLLDGALGKVGSARAKARRDRLVEGDEGGGGMSWLVWIGLLLFINLLSYLFDWPFWIY